MKQIGIRQFNQNISKYLKELPLQITNRNMVVATIIPGDNSKVATEDNTSLHQDVTTIEGVSDKRPAYSTNNPIHSVPKPKFNLKNKIR